MSKPKVAFVCVHNSCRSQMAEALGKAIADIHDQHKHEVLTAALMAPVDALGIAVMGGKMVGLCKYAVRNA